MLMLLLEKHLIWSRADGRQTIYYYYDDRITWVVVTMAVIWIAWLLIRRYRLARALRRPPRGINYRLLKRTIKIKDELSSRYLVPGLITNLHAVGIGRLSATNDYCIQFFVTDATQELWPGAGTTTLPPSYRGIPLMLLQMPRASFLVGAARDLRIERPTHHGPIRDYQNVTVGGISGANTKLDGQSGTIGYFCRLRSKRRRREVYLLSNSHVFVDLKDPQVREDDLIMQPSPGEKAGNKPIGALTKFSPLKFPGDEKDPNFIDAAIAKLKDQQAHQAVIPSIGAVEGYVPKLDVDVGETVRKLGRTTGYTEGRIVSLSLNIKIDYDRTRKTAFFKDQFLIEPPLPSVKVVDKGDSGSLVVDEHLHAIGLICAGRSTDPRQTSPPVNSNVPTIEGYGIANPISEVLDQLGIDLLIN